MIHSNRLMVSSTIINNQRKLKSDTILSFSAIPIKAAEMSSHVAIVVTARGGHIAFLEGFWPGNKDQYMSRIFGQYFSAALFDKDDEFARTIQEVNETLVSEWWSEDDGDGLKNAIAGESSNSNDILNEPLPGSSREVS